MIRILNRVHSTIDPKEVLQFSSHKWWNSSNPLHAFSDIRGAYILKHLGVKDLNGVRVLDVGCGGGIMTERLAELGATVTGVDPTEKAILIAKDHLPRQYKDRVRYIKGEVSELNETFDLVLASEVIEHVLDREKFISDISHRLKLDGDLFLSTINKTFESWFFSILLAEQVIGLIEPGTHTWEKFIEPGELAQICWSFGINTMNTQGWLLDPIRNQACFVDYTRIGYLMHCKKTRE